MNLHNSCTLGLLLAASSLSAQVIISGTAGLATETYSTAINTNGGNSLSLAFMVDYLVVGGGGGGAGSGNDTGAWGGGGGGAGGMLTGGFNLSSVSADNVYTVTVGVGGSGGPRSGTTSLQQGTNGGNSVLGDITALGGGGGGAYKFVGSAGGSGGGGGGRGTGNNLRTAGGAGTAGQGFGGGDSRDDDSTGRTAGGGGGGADGLGGVGGTDASIGGNGGLGLASSITGSSVIYAAGGGGGAIDTNGGSSETAGTGGYGIGGNGSTSGNASAGATNTGSGGGGVGHQGVGGSGGSGIVIVRYKGANAVHLNGFVTSAAGTGDAEGYNINTFTNTGTTSLDFGLLNLDTRLGSVVSSSVSGSGALTINTQGTIRYTGSATHTGGTVISDGILQLGNGGTEGSLSGDVSIATGATLEYNRSANSSLRLSSSGTFTKKGAGALIITDGDVIFSGVLNVIAGTLQLGSSFAFSAQNIVFSAGRISSDSASARTLARGIFLSNSSGLSLGDTINNGTLDIQGNLGLGYSSNTLNVDSEVLVSGVVTGFSGSVGLTKLGSGTLILSGNNTYSGNTTVSAGTLIVNGTQARSEIGFQAQGEHFIAAGATLGGSGTIHGDTTISGIHTPGNSPGIQTFGGNLNYLSGANVNWELAANTASNSPTVLFDQIVVNGNLDFVGPTTLQMIFNLSGSTVDWTDAFWASNQSWILYDVAGTTTDFEDLNIANITYTDANGVLLGNARGGASFFLSQEGSDVQLNFTAVPEPSTYGLILGTLALAGAAIRRRSQRHKFAR